MIRFRTKYALALANIIVAIVLFALGSLSRMPSGMNMGPVPIQLCYWINTPATFIWNHLTTLLSSLLARVGVDLPYKTAFPIYVGILLVIVGVCWYLIGMEIESFRRKRQFVGPVTPVLRISLDLLLLGFGLLIAFQGFTDSQSPHVWPIVDFSGWGLVHDILITFWAVILVMAGLGDLFMYWRATARMSHQISGSDGAR